MADGSERLPWLDGPRSEPAPRRRNAAPWGWAAGVLALLGVGAGAYWLGTREASPSEQPEDRIAATPPTYPPVTMPEQPLDMADLAPAAEEQAVSIEEDSLAVPPPLRRSREAVRQIREAAQAARQDDPVADMLEEEEQLAATNTAVPELPASAPPPITRPTPVIVRTPGQSWGRKVQLGAYRTPAQADVAWRALVRRYPYLASKPKLVSGLDVRSTDGRATRMYRLQLATASQAQSVVICQRLQKAGQSCVVVY